MFSRDPAPVRDALPTADEGDALLDMLFEDAKGDRPSAEPADDMMTTTLLRSPQLDEPPPASARPGPPPLPPPTRSSPGAAAAPPPRPAPPTAPCRPASAAGRAFSTAAAPAHAFSSTAAADAAAAPAGAGRSSRRARDSRRRSRRAALGRPSLRRPRLGAGAGSRDRPAASARGPGARFGRRDRPRRAAPEKKRTSTRPRSRSARRCRRRHRSGRRARPRRCRASTARTPRRCSRATSSTRRGPIRAGWLREEAQAEKDRAARSRGMLVVSELCAMIGDEQNARAAAAEARELAPTSPLPHRQVRGLLARQAEWPAVLEELEGEGQERGDADGSLPPRARRRRDCSHRARGRRAGPASARARGSGFSRRIRGRTRIGSRPRSSTATRTLHRKVRRRSRRPACPRPRSSCPSPRRWRTLLAHRGLAPKTRAPATPFESVLRARAEFEAGQPAAALEPLLGVLGAESLGGGLAGSSRRSRRHARRPARERSSACALCSTVRTRRSPGDRSPRAPSSSATPRRPRPPSTARAATRSRPAIGWRSPRSREARAPTSRPGKSRSGTTKISRPSPPPIDALEPASAERIPRAIGTAPNRAGVTLGRALAAGALGPIADAVGLYADAVPGSGVDSALTLELFAATGAGGKIATLVAGWREDGELERERLLASALIAEVSGESQRAQDNFEKIRGSEPSLEAAARARLAHVDDAEAAEMLAELRRVASSPAPARRCSSPRRRSASPRTPRRRTRSSARRPSSIPSCRSRPTSASARPARAAIATASSSGCARVARRPTIRSSRRTISFARRSSCRTPTARPRRVSSSRRSARDRPTSDSASSTSGSRPSRPPIAAPGALARAEGVERGRGGAPGPRGRVRVRARPATGRRSPKAARIALAGGDTALAPIVAYRAALDGHGAGDVIDGLLPTARETDDRARAARDLRAPRRARRARPRRRRERAPLAPDDPRGDARAPSHACAASRARWSAPVATTSSSRSRSTSRAPSTASSRSRTRWSRRASGSRRRAGTTRARRSRSATAHMPRAIWALRQMAAHARARNDHELALEVDRAAHRAHPARRARRRRSRSAPRRARPRPGCRTTRWRSWRTRSSSCRTTSSPTSSSRARSSNRATRPAPRRASRPRPAASAGPNERAHDLYRAALLWQDKVERRRPRPRTRSSRSPRSIPPTRTCSSGSRRIYVADGARGELADAPRAAARRRHRSARARRDGGPPRPRARRRRRRRRGQARARRRPRGEPRSRRGARRLRRGRAAEQDWSRRGAGVDPPRAARPRSRAAGGDLLPPRRPLRRAHARTPSAPSSPTTRSSSARPTTRGRASASSPSTSATATPPAPSSSRRSSSTPPRRPRPSACAPTELAEIYEMIGDAKKAEATLLQARKTWPKDDVALAALARFYHRNNQEPAAQVLLDRAVADARRALGDRPLRAVPLQHRRDRRGAPQPARRGAHRAGRRRVARRRPRRRSTAPAVAPATPRLDDLLAPEVMTPAFRELLATDRPAPRRGDAVRSHARSARRRSRRSSASSATSCSALGAGVRPARRSTSTSRTRSGQVCIPVSAYPPALVLGQALVASPREDVRGFLIHRALKAFQTNAAALSRTAPIDLWPLLAAYLKAFNPNWAPQGVDQAKLTDFYGRVARGMQGRPTRRSALLAARGHRHPSATAPRRSTPSSTAGATAPACSPSATSTSPSPAIAWAGGHAGRPARRRQGPPHLDRPQRRGARARRLLGERRLRRRARPGRPRRAGLRKRRARATNRDLTPRHPSPSARPLSQPESSSAGERGSRSHVSRRRSSSAPPSPLREAIQVKTTVVRGEGGRGGAGG